MPAKTTLKTIQEAMSFPKVNTQLEAYAVGILVYEQEKNRKNQTQKIKSLQQELKTLEPLTQAYHEKESLLHEIENQPELGFYYTIELFDKLADTHPHEAKQMIEALLSLDTIGRYILEQRLVSFDEHSFILNHIVSKHKIDTTVLTETARINQAHMTCSIVPIEMPIPLIAMKPFSFSLPSDLSVFEETIERTTSRIQRLTTYVNVSETLQKKIEQVPLDFSLVSQSPKKEESIQGFLAILAEIFSHAKTQDSAKLDTLNATYRTSSKIITPSTVTFLQNNLSNWFIASLVQAKTTAEFNQRLSFIIAVFTEATGKSPHLPLNANADMYLPLFTFSQIITQTALQYHPDVIPHLAHIQKISHLTQPKDITEFTNTIQLADKTAKTRSKRAISLPPMRMAITTKMDWRTHVADLRDADHSDDDVASRQNKAKDTLARGQAVLDYFKPQQQPFFGPLNKLSSHAEQLFQQQSTIEWFFESHHETYFIRDLLHISFPIHNPKDDNALQLQILNSALLSPGPRIFYHKKSKLFHLEGEEALEYIKEETKKIIGLTPMLTTDSSSKITPINAWADDILTKAQQLQSRHISVPKTAADPQPAHGGKHSLHFLSLFRKKFAPEPQQPQTSSVNDEKSTPMDKLYHHRCSYV